MLTCCQHALSSVLTFYITTPILVIISRCGSSCFSLPALFSRFSPLFCTFVPKRGIAGTAHLAMNKRRSAQKRGTINGLIVPPLSARISEKQVLSDARDKHLYAMRLYWAAM